MLRPSPHEITQLQRDWRGGSEQAQEELWPVAARAMRFVLVDEARRRMSQRRDGEARGAEIPEDTADPTSHRPEDVLAVHEALGRLAKSNPRHERLVEARHFAGLSIDETAEALAVSRPTVVRDWRAVRTWLYGELQRQPQA